VIRLWKLSVAISVVTLGMTCLTAGSEFGNTQVRLINAMNGEGAETMKVNNVTVVTGVTYGAGSTYEPSPCGSQSVEILSGGITLLNQSETINCRNNNTILATNSGLTVFLDKKSKPPSGKFDIRVIDGSASTSPEDVYIVGCGVNIATVSPTATLSFQEASQYLTFPAGGYQIIFTLQGTKLLEIASGCISFSSQYIYTGVSMDGNGLFFTLLTDHAPPAN
jgi:hypothetical protein